MNYARLVSGTRAFDETLITRLISNRSKVKEKKITKTPRFEEPRLGHRFILIEEHRGNRVQVLAG